MHWKCTYMYILVHYGKLCLAYFVYTSYSTTIQCFNIYTTTEVNSMTTTLMFWRSVLHTPHLNGLTWFSAALCSQDRNELASSATSTEDTPYEPHMERESSSERPSTSERPVKTPPTADSRALKGPSEPQEEPPDPNTEDRLHIEHPKSLPTAPDESHRTPRSSPGNQ